MLVKNINFQIGADPEVFMGKKGKFVSAHDAVPGTKEEPFVVPNGAVQVDGMALEFNIDPADNFEQFKNNLESVQNTLAGMIGDNELIEDVSVFFDEQFLENVPEFNKVLGCSADYNGWTMGENPQPDQNVMMRTAGGHVHIGGFFSDDPFTKDHFNNCARLARIMDETLGVYSILWDKDDQRRSLYGQAGSFRPKQYGMEYRTLSNKWIFDNKLIRFVYDATKEALDKMFDKSYEPDDSIRKIINNSNRESNFFLNNKKAESLV